MEVKAKSGQTWADAQVAALLPATAALALPGCAGLGLPEATTTQGRDIAGLWALFFWAGVAVAAVVIGLILWSILRYGERDGIEAATFREHMPIEVV